MKIFNLMKNLVENIDDLEKAQNPNTPSEELEQIGFHNLNKDIQIALGQNPNNSLKGILNSAGDLGANSHLVFENPAFHLFALENPNFLHQTRNYTALNNFAINPHTPEYVQASLANHPSDSIAQNLAYNTHIAPAAAKILYNRGQENEENTYNEPVYSNMDSEFHDVLGANPGIPDEIHQEYLKKLNNPKRSYFGLSVLSNPKTDPKIIHNYLDQALNSNEIDKTMFDKTIFASLNNKNLSSEHLQKIEKHPAVGTETHEEYILSHPNVPNEMLQKYIENSWPGDKKRHYTIANNPSTNNKTLKMLIKKTNNKDVLAMIGRHPNYEE